MSKVVHVCVGGPYTDGFTYQENALSKHHRLLGYEVVLIASPLCYMNGSQVGYAPVGRYVNEDGVKIIRLPFARPKAIFTKFKRVVGLYRQLEEESPDIIFLHGIQTMVCSDVAKYLSKNTDVKLYVDNHVDKSNMGGSLHRLLIDKTIWRHEGKTLLPFASAYYGVLPARVRSLSEIYGIPANRCELLVMGYDDDLDKRRLALTQKQIDDWFINNGIAKDNLIICTGGKIDKFKMETWKLLHYVADGNLPKNMQLVLFGSVEPEKEAELHELCSSSNQIHYYGWADKYQLTALIRKADVCAYLGRHSVLWEQAVGEAVPLIIKDLNGYEHLDRNGNVWCIGDRVDTEALNRMIRHLQCDEEMNIQKEAALNASDRFRYSTIARESLQVEKRW